MCDGARGEVSATYTFLLFTAVVLRSTALGAHTEPALVAAVGLLAGFQRCLVSTFLLLGVFDATMGGDFPIS